jgi:hypothetical protein
VLILWGPTRVFLGGVYPRANPVGCHAYGFLSWHVRQHVGISAVVFRGVTCLIKIRISLISEDHDSELQSGPTSFWTESSTPMACGL